MNGFPLELPVKGDLVITISKGENGQQSPAACYRRAPYDPLGLHWFHTEGAALGYVNWTDVDRLLQTITHIAAGFETNFARVPLIAVGCKHGNPCGAAVGDRPVDVMRRTIAGDPLALFGGWVIANFPIGRDEAELFRTGGSGGNRLLLDGIIAPDFTSAAKEILGRKNGRCRFVTNPALANLTVDSLDKASRLRSVRGGFLLEPNYTFLFDFDDPDLLVHGDLHDSQRQDLVLAWAIGCTSNSNTITIVSRGMLLGNGVGQQDRVGAAELAISRARRSGHDCSGAVAYSDSFFPFDDGPGVLLEVGVTCILATSGSMNDRKVVAAVTARGATICLIPDAKARGFFGH